MKMKKMQAVTGLALLTAGFSIMISHESKISMSNSIVQSSSKTVIPESIYIGLNHIENDMIRLKKNIQSSDILSIQVAPTNSESELVSFRQTESMLNNLITWLKEKQLLFRNDVSRSVPGFPLEERLKEEVALKDWKAAMNKGLTLLISQVNNLNVDEATKTEIKKRLTNISTTASKIAWSSRSVSTKVVTAKANPAGIILNQMQKNLAQLDKEILNFSQAKIEESSKSESRNGSPWLAWMMAFGGLTIFIEALSQLRKSKGRDTQKKSSEGTSTLFSGVTISETSVFDRLNQSIFYLSGSYDILWANAAAKKMSMTKSDLSYVVKNAYKDEDGKRISSFNNSDFWLDVEYLDQKMADGNKIFCLIMAEVNDSSSQIKMNSNDFETMMESSLDQLDFDFT